MANKKVKIKPRNAGTLTESAFWSFIRSTLRRRTIVWKPIAQCKLNAKREYTGPNKRQKFEYLCNGCKRCFPEKSIAVDHIIPAGSLQSARDLPEFVEKLFCEVEYLQVLCSTCHDAKTIKDRNNIKNNKKE